MKFRDLVFGNKPFLYDATNKAENQQKMIFYMLCRTQSMFEYKGLPDTIPARMLEIFLQYNGYVGIYKHNGNLYAYNGGLGGEPDEYYRPTLFTIANPAQNLTVNARIGVDCVVIPSDPLYMGMIPMFSKYSAQMVENELSLYIADINSRIISLISAGDDTTKASAEQYLQNIKDGKLGVIGENAFLDGVKSQPFTMSGHGIITDLIEYEQYLKASWFNDLGLNANYNMKREAINSGESQLNNDALLPLVDAMLACRKEGIEQVNKMFSTDISVSLASAWLDNAQEIDLEQGQMENQSQDQDQDQEREEDDADAQ